MKRLLLVGFVLGHCGVSMVVAEDAKQPDLARAAVEMQKKLLDQFDTNKDGVLSETERVAAAEELKKNGMQPLSVQLPLSGEFLKKFDKNRDGKLSDAEKLMAQSAWQKMRAGAGGGGPVVGGGGLGGDGFGGLPGGINAPTGDGDKPTKKVNPLIKLYDKDGDGKLNDEEKAALQADRNKKKNTKKEDKP